MTRVAALVFALGLGQPDGALALLPLAAVLEKLDAFEALQDGALAGAATADFQTVVLGHGDWAGWIFFEGAGR